MNSPYKNNISFEESLEKDHIKKIDDSENNSFKRSDKNYKDIKQYFGMMGGKFGTMEDIDDLIAEGRSERKDRVFG